jgi:hypothetical protein
VDLFHVSEVTNTPDARFKVTGFYVKHVSRELITLLPYKWKEKEDKKTQGDKSICISTRHSKKACFISCSIKVTRACFIFYMRQTNIEFPWPRMEVLLRVIAEYRVTQVT